MSATYAADAFAGQAVLVTGGAQGIGLAIVSAFARLGAEVTIADVQLPQAQAAAQTLRGEGLSVQALACDLAEPGQIAELVTAVGERHQRLDVVIHNAAYFPLTPFAAIDAALLQRTLSVNLMAPFFLAQAALPWMRRRRRLPSGDLVGDRPAGGLPGAGALRRLQGRGERVYSRGGAGAGGGENSRQRRGAGDDPHAGDGQPGRRAGESGDRRLGAARAAGEPEDIAAAMVFLASPAAAYITGQTLVVDGGALLPETNALLT